jgi:hypothetical protein
MGRQGGEGGPLRVDERVGGVMMGGGRGGREGGGYPTGPHPT